MEHRINYLDNFSHTIPAANRSEHQVCSQLLRTRPSITLLLSTMPSALGHKADSAAVAVTKLVDLVTSPAFIQGGATAASFVSFASIALPLCAITATVSGIQAMSSSSAGSRNVRRAEEGSNRQ
jgi:hypothetical protein